MPPYNPPVGSLGWQLIQSGATASQALFYVRTLTRSQEQGVTPQEAARNRKQAKRWETLNQQLTAWQATPNTSTVYDEFVVQPGAGGKTEPGPEPTPPAPPIDPAQVAALTYPWMPAQLIDLYVQAWEQTGDPDLSLASVRADPIYDTFFPGNRTDDGTFRMTELSYMATVDRFNQELITYGLNPAVFEGRYGELIAGEVSANEFRSRLQTAYQRITQNLPAIRDYYTAQYGIDMTDEGIFGSFIDPDVNSAVLDQRITMAEIGGVAAMRGYDLGLTRAGKLAAAGINKQSAMDLYSRAVRDVPTIGGLAGRFGDVDRTFDIREYEDLALGDPMQAARIERLLGQSAAEFSEGAATVREGWRVRGLRPL